MQELNKETQEKIQQLQILEQTLQNILFQRQAFQIEFNESEAALKEAEKSSEEIYKITGQIMTKATKEEIIKELEEKLKVLEIRIKSIEKQEALLMQKAENIKKHLEDSFKSK